MRLSFIILIFVSTALYAQKDEVFTIVETQPEYIGGSELFYKSISKGLKYPTEAKKNGIQGRVYVEFIVDKDGSITNVRTVKGIGYGCDEAAAESVKSLPNKFTPGLQDGQPVRVKMVLPLNFTLPAKYLKNKKENSEIAFSGPFFSGEIVYKITKVSKDGQDGDDRLSELQFGDISKYLITDRYYKATYLKENEFSYSYTYHDETKRMYDEYANKDYITFRDSQKSNVEYGESEVKMDSSITVLGYKCFMYKSESELGKITSFYSEDLRVNPDSFKGHLVGNWYQKLKEVGGSLPLKSVTEHETYFEIREAIEINKREVHRLEFDLTKGKNIVASLDALDVIPSLVEPSNNVIQCYLEKVQNAPEHDDVVSTYVIFILDEQGEISDIEKIDENAFSDIAADILENCGIQFSPGILGGQSVKSQMFFPVQFK